MAKEYKSHKEVKPNPGASSIYSSRNTHYRNSTYHVVNTKKLLRRNFKWALNLPHYSTMVILRPMLHFDTLNVPAPYKIINGIKYGNDN